MISQIEGEYVKEGQGRVHSCKVNDGDQLNENKTRVYVKGILAAQCPVQEKVVVKCKQIRKGENDQQKLELERVKQHKRKLQEGNHYCIRNVQTRKSEKFLEKL
jgi:hypothetical protein